MVDKFNIANEDFVCFAKFCQTYLVKVIIELSDSCTDMTGSVRPDGSLRRPIVAQESNRLISGPSARGKWNQQTISESSQWQLSNFDSRLVIMTRLLVGDLGPV